MPNPIWESVQPDKNFLTPKYKARLSENASLYCMKTYNGIYAAWLTDTTKKIEKTVWQPAAFPANSDADAKEKAIMLLFDELIAKEDALQNVLNAVCALGGVAISKNLARILNERDKTANNAF